MRRVRAGGALLAVLAIACADAAPPTVLAGGEICRSRPAKPDPTRPPRSSLVHKHAS